MTAPCDPEASPEPGKEGQHIVLRLGDILPRVPDHFLKPGPHDTLAKICFSVDELAEKIARGRVSVPLERLASAYPNVFKETNAFTGEDEIQLPLQKLLEQVGLVAPKSHSPNGMPKEEIAKARIQASRILQAASAPPVKFPSPSLPIFPGTIHPDSREASPTTQTVPAGHISLRVLSIFRLLPADILRPGPLPSHDIRVAFPLASIEPQLASGHVEIPINDFVQALPEGLRQAINPVAEATIWVPLDEVFQNLPPGHPFHMPPPDTHPNPVATPIEKSTSADVIHEKKETPPGEIKPAQRSEPSQNLADNPSPALAHFDSPLPVKTSTQEIIPVNEPSPERQPTETVPPSAEPSPAAAAPPPSRSPWIHGFRIPAPRLFSGSVVSAEATSVPAPSEPAPTPVSTPEAKRTADFLAGQPGIFAAAAFVQGAVFASADFPRKPDLEVLREFMGAFIDNARESGQRLGWNGVLSIACGQFHVTTVVRERYFIVALHYDRVLSPSGYDALIAAADDLNTAAV